jgi:hypothetical protein
MDVMDVLMDVMDVLMDVMDVLMDVMDVLMDVMDVLMTVIRCHHGNTRNIPAYFFTNCLVVSEKKKLFIPYSLMLKICSIVATICF